MNIAERGSNEVDLFVDPFEDLRQTVMNIANFLDTGCFAWSVQDQEGRGAVSMRVSSNYLYGTLASC